MRPDSALVGAVSRSPNFGDRRGRAIDAIVLHYTGMASGALARERLCTPGSEVSCHYLVWEDGLIEQLVDERYRAWHAGRSFWGGERDLNAVSIGIEIVNGGHDFGCPPYPEVQVAAVTALVADVCARRAIAPRRVLGHSDIAPDRKEDPGEHFPWCRLEEAGLARRLDRGGLGCSEPGSTHLDADVIRLQTQLAAYGYAMPVTGAYDPATEAVVRAVQRRFRPTRVDGRADAETIAVIEALATA